MGLLTADEAKYAGIMCDNSSYTSYLKFSGAYWTMTPKWGCKWGIYAYASPVDQSGRLTEDWVFSSLGVRPTIALKSSTIVSSGTGSYDDPFIIE